MQVGVLENVTEEARRIAELAEQANSRPIGPSCTKKAEELRAGV